MKKIKFFTSDGNETMEFGFNQITEIAYNNNYDWITITAAGRTITLSHTPMVAYDDEITNSRVLLDWGAFWKNEMNEAYADSEKILVVFTSGQVPVMLFHGKVLKFIKKEAEAVLFEMDEKPLWLYEMSYLILSRK